MTPIEAHKVPQIVKKDDDKSTSDHNHVNQDMANNVTNNFVKIFLIVFIKFVLFKFTIQS